MRLVMFVLVFLLPLAVVQAASDKTCIALVFHEPVDFKPWRTELQTLLKDTLNTWYDKAVAREPRPCLHLAKFTEPVTGTAAKLSASNHKDPVSLKEITEFVNKDSAVVTQADLKKVIEDAADGTKKTVGNSEYRLVLVYFGFVGQIEDNLISNVYNVLPATNPPISTLLVYEISKGNFRATSTDPEIQAFDIKDSTQFTETFNRLAGWDKGENKDGKPKEGMEDWVVAVLAITGIILLVGCGVVGYRKLGGQGNKKETEPDGLQSEGSEKKSEGHEENHPKEKEPPRKTTSPGSKIAKSKEPTHKSSRKSPGSQPGVGPLGVVPRTPPEQPKSTVRVESEKSDPKPRKSRDPAKRGKQ